MITLKTIIRIADSAYPDGLVARCAKSGKDEGDTLALFVARELKDTYTDHDSQGRELTSERQLTVSIKAMRRAIRELKAVKAILIRARRVRKEPK